MKILSKSSVYVIAVLSFFAVSCAKEPVETYVPSEWQYDSYSNTDILPGDDFYRYVCGRGIDTEGSDSWAPIPRWNKQGADFSLLAYSDGDDNPVPVLKRINELKSEFVSSAPGRAAAFASIQTRLAKIKSLERIEDFPLKAAEYYLNGYNFFFMRQVSLDGHKFGIMVSPLLNELLHDWPEELLLEAGISKEYYDSRFKEALRFQNFLHDTIDVQGPSMASLNASIASECLQLKNYVASYASTRAYAGAFERFSNALGNKNPDFLPSDETSRRYFNLWDKAGEELPDAAAAADAYLWCAAVSFDLGLLFDSTSQLNFFLSILYPNLIMNISHTFCDMYADEESTRKNQEIFQSLRSTLSERIERSDWMTPYSKARAMEKVNAMQCHHGIFDWSKYEADMPVSSDICSAMHEIGISYVTKMMSYSGENKDLDHIVASLYLTPATGIPAYAPNSFYIRNCNAMCILPSTSILTDMNPELPFQTFVIAHEICHGFDSEGSRYNANGEFGDWWSIDDKLEFKKKQNQLIDAFNQYYIGGSTFCNGAKTIDEDMADLGGLEISWYNALKSLSIKYDGAELEDMKRRFFKTYALLWAQYKTLEEKIKSVGNDEHSAYEYRVNGIVNNIDDWYSLFDVTPQSRFYLSADRRVHLW